MTEWLHFHLSLLCIGEGHGNPLQCSCLENPRDGGAWWAAVYGVTQSWTRLKRLRRRPWKTELAWKLMLMKKLTGLMDAFPLSTCSLQTRPVGLSWNFDLVLSLIAIFTFACMKRLYAFQLRIRLVLMLVVEGGREDNAWEKSCKYVV